MSEDKKAPFWWSTIAKILYFVATGVFGAIILRMNGCVESLGVADRIANERQQRVDALIIDRMEVEDSIRLARRNDGWLNSSLKLLDFTLLDDSCNHTINRASVARWFRSDFRAEKTLANYNTVQVLAEISIWGATKYMPRFRDAQRISYSMPGTREYLDGLKTLNQVFVYTTYDTTKFMRSIASDEFTGWYLNEAKVCLGLYLGYTEDVEEQWYLTVWPDSAAFESNPKRFFDEMYNAKREIKQSMRLKD